MNVRSFLRKIDVGPSSANCWRWTGAIGSDDYGVLRVDSRTVSAHRHAYEVFKGPIPEGLCVLHCCDNTLCVNPTHLFLGTKKDNSADMRQKGRQGMPLHKLTWPQVLEIRAAIEVGEKKRVVASRYGVCRSTIQDIANGVTWKEQERDDGQMELFAELTSCPSGQP